MHDEFITVPLTNGLIATIDAEDADRVLAHKWYARFSNTNIYAGTTVKVGKMLMHRFILDAPKGSMVDHVDGDGLNNRRSNLRYCNYAQNGTNSRNHKIGKWGYRGVTWHPYGYWCARIRADGRRISLGYFSSPEEAALAYDEAAKAMHGEFAVLNFP